jgi:hypothetical protein
MSRGSRRCGNTRFGSKVCGLERGKCWERIRLLCGETLEKVVLEKGKMVLGTRKGKG